MLDQWTLIELDLQDLGIDVGNTTLMASRSWRWLRVRILGLLDAPPVYVGIADGSIRAMPSTRLAQHFQRD